MTAKEIYLEIRDILISGGVDSPENDARELIAHFLGENRMALASAEAHDVSDSKRLAVIEAAKKRAGGYPLQYILGSWSFMGIDLDVCEGVLIPRDDTEVCVRECMALLSQRHGPFRIIDLCSGSGAIALALSAYYPDAEITAAELSETAFSVLCRNIEKNGASNVRAVKEDILTCADIFPDGSFDAIISNPPYIPSSELQTLQREVQSEPAMALDGGADGLDFYRAIASLWVRKLKQGGIIALEIGEEQSGSVCELLENNGVTGLRVTKDLGFLDRAVTGIVQ